MKLVSSLLPLLALVTSSIAQRPSNTSICDYYTTALLKNNTAANQQTLVTLVVNTAVIGNYTMPNVGIKVAGILAPGTVNGTAVNLLPYFTGALASSNRGGSSGVSINFLDDGGAAPLMMNMPANGTSSNQYKLLTHLYQYFGALLGCSAMGYPAYTGQGSQYSVHKYMALNVYEVTYFIQQVGLSAASFGVATADITAVGTALNNLFGYRCAPPAVVIPSQGAQLQAICIADNCPVAPMPTCAAYAPVMRPANATSPATMSGSATMSSAPVATFKGAADKNAVGLSAAALALVAMVL